MSEDSRSETPEDSAPAGPTPTSRVARRLLDRRTRAESERQQQGTAAAEPPSVTQDGAPDATIAPDTPTDKDVDEGTGATEATGAMPSPPLEAFSSDELIPDEPSAEKGREGKDLLSGTGRRLRRMLDEDIQDELDDVMSQFDAEEVFRSAQSQPILGEGGQDAQHGEAEGVPPRRTVRVLSVRGEDVYVDLGEKSEGIVPAAQFEAGVLAAGDMIEVVIDRFDSASETYFLRRPGASQEADWGSVAKGMIVDAQVKKVNKGGLEVTVNGIRGFMPAGQVDIWHIADLSELVGQTLRSEVTEVSLSEKNLILSRKAILEREREEQKAATLASLAEGQVREGIVTSIKDFGAFVDIGGVDGLVHISQLSWSRVKHPSEVLAVGQKIKAVVLKHEAGKISLGLRQLLASPWDDVAENYPVGAIVSGLVTKLMAFGAFVELEPGVEGLIHISELAPKRVHRVTEIVREGQQVEVKVLGCDTEQKRISLSLKQAAPEQPEPEPPPQADASSEPEADEETPEDRPAAKQPQVPLKGGLGGGPAGPLFG